MSLFFRKVVLSRSVLFFTLFCFSLNTTVYAAMVSTIQSVNSNLSAPSNSINLEMNINRAALKQQLIAFGVEAEQVSSRLDSMTDIEIAALTSEISELPAGGDALSVIALVFLVLLFTDIAGYTDLFPFVKKTARNSSPGTPHHDGEVIDRRNNANRKEPVVIEN